MKRERPLSLYKKGWLSTEEMTASELGAYNAELAGYLALKGKMPLRLMTPKVLTMVYKGRPLAVNMATAGNLPAELLNKDWVLDIEDTDHGYPAGWFVRDIVAYKIGDRVNPPDDYHDKVYRAIKRGSLKPFQITDRQLLACRHDFECRGWTVAHELIAHANVGDIEALNFVMAILMRLKTEPIASARYENGLSVKEALGLR